MATRRPRARRRRPRTAAHTARSVRSAAARAVERVLSSRAAFALLVRRLEAAGWHIERAPGDERAASAAAPARAR